MENSEKQITEQLTDAQKKRIKKNRERALLLKKTRLTAHPYSKGHVVSIDKTKAHIGATKYKDTGGGFLLEEKPDSKESEAKITEQNFPLALVIDRPICEICEKSFATSYLLDTFDHKVCDECKDCEKHKLITKTEAKNEYLLKEHDFEKRGEPLKYVLRKNPHNIRWGEMKLYLLLQVEKRALEVWGSEEKLEKELRKRAEKHILAKTKKYQKKMKELRMNVRSSLYDKTTAASHTHNFEEESYNEDDETYAHTCTSCGYEEKFEKM